MTDERPEGPQPEAEEERLKRPEDKIKDLESPPEESDEVRGGLDGGSKDSNFKY
jgi:hypothetical protein